LRADRKDPARYHLDAQEGLADVIKAALQLLKLKEFIGTEEPTVIT
jgi:hypothetical protein